LPSNNVTMQSVACQCNESNRIDNKSTQTDLSFLFSQTNNMECQTEIQPIQLESNAVQTEISYYNSSTFSMIDNIIDQNVEFHNVSEALSKTYDLTETDFSAMPADSCLEVCDTLPLKETLQANAYAEDSEIVDTVVKYASDVSSVVDEVFDATICNSKTSEPIPLMEMQAEGICRMLFCVLRQSM